MQETQVQFLGPEDTLEKGLVPHSSMLAWRILMDRGTWRATVHGVTKSDTTELTHTHTHTHTLSLSLSLPLSLYLSLRGKKTQLEKW